MLRILFLPFTLAANLVGLLLELTGKAIGFVLGLVLTIAGLALCATLIGAVLGVPLLLIGGSMLFHCIW